MFSLAKPLYKMLKCISASAHSTINNKLKDKINMAIEHFSTLKQHLSKQIIGQPAFVENLLIALLRN